MKKVTNNAIFIYEESDSFLIEEISKYLDKNKDEVCDFFRTVVTEKPVINIIDTKENFDRIYREYYKLEDREEVPKWMVGVSTPDMQIYCVSLNDYKNTTHAFKEEDYLENLESYKKNVLHEYVHHVNRIFCKNNECEYTARFLSEGIAQYLSHQKDDMPIIFEYTLENIINRSKCYNGWYLVTKYMIENYPHNLILELATDQKKAYSFIKERFNEIKEYYINLENTK